MLVLSRKAGERIDIGDEITIEVRKVAGNRVTIALEAPRHLRILRSELKQAVQEFEIEIPEQSSPTKTDSAPGSETSYAVVHHRIPAANSSVPA